MTFEESWTEAEKTVYEHLLAATDSRDKENAYLGVLPHMVNVWRLDTGGSGGNEQTTWSPDVVSIHMPADIVGQFTDRDAAQAFAMQVIKALPLTGEDNVQNFRIANGGMPTIEPDAIDAGGESKKFLVYVVTIRFDFVFSTGGRL